MTEKKKLEINCDVCDARKIKEENYSHYEEIAIHADVVLISEKSKDIFMRLPITLDSDKVCELAEDVEASVKTVNGSYEITGGTCVAENTILVVNGPLTVEPGTEEILKSFLTIGVNGSVRYPKNMEGYLSRMTVNGRVETYPDDCVILKDEFIIDKYFPLRAGEGSRYYVKNRIIMKDKSVDIAKLAAKNVRFVTKQFIVPECKIEESVPMFDEKTEFIVVPEGMELVYGECVLNEKLLETEGKRLFIYGDLKIDEAADFSTLCNQIEKLIVKGSVWLKGEQEEAFRSLDAQYDKIEIISNKRRIQCMAEVRLDKKLFDDSPDGIEVCNVAKVVIAEDVSPEMILEKLLIRNCAGIVCSEEQESAVSAVASNIARLGKDSPGEGGNDNAAEKYKKFAEKREINADSYIM